MIIVEGPDNTGKTTLIKELSQYFPELQVVKSPGHVVLGEALAWVAGAIRNEDPRFIYDRYFPISERVYGPVLRDGDIFGQYTFDLLRLTLRREPLIVYCRPSDEVAQMWGDRQQLNGVKQHAAELCRRYDWLMTILGEMYCQKGLLLRYDYTHPEALNHVKGAVQLYLKTHRIFPGIKLVSEKGVHG